MVGVPGRSKACLTCRARRKGCSRERPACAQCRNAGLECGGYETPRVFVISTPENRRVGYSASAANSGSPARTAPNRVPGTGPRSRQPVPVPRQTTPSSIADPHLLTQPATEQRCFDLFWEAYYPAGAPLPEFIVRSYFCTWTETARKLSTQDEALRYSLWANCLVAISTRRVQVPQNLLGGSPEWMLHEGQRMYGRALACLRSLLGSSQGAKKDAALATVKLLGLFEALSQHEASLLAQAQRWRQHHFGELALLLSRRPEAHTRGDSHYVFTDERAEMGLSALLTRKHLPIEDQEWKSVPWKEIPRDLKDVLVDSLVDVPGLVEHFDEYTACTDASKHETLRQEVLEHSRRLDDQLTGWLNAVRAIAPRPPDSDCLRCGENDLVIHTARVHGMALYYTTAMVLYGIMRNVAGPQDEMPSHADPVFHATKLAQAIDILLKPHSGLYGRQNAALPLAVALEHHEKLVRPFEPEGSNLLARFKALDAKLAQGSTGQSG